MKLRNQFIVHTITPHIRFIVHDYSVAPRLVSLSESWEKPTYSTDYEGVKKRARTLLFVATTILKRENKWQNGWCFGFDRDTPLNKCYQENKDCTTTEIVVNDL